MAAAAVRATTGVPTKGRCRSASIRAVLGSSSASRQRRASAPATSSSVDRGAPRRGADRRRRSRQPRCGAHAPPRRAVRADRGARGFARWPGDIATIHGRGDGPGRGRGRRHRPPPRPARASAARRPRQAGRPHVALHDEMIAVLRPRPMTAAELAGAIVERGRYAPPRSGKPLDAAMVSQRVSNPTYRSRFTRHEGRIGLAE